MRNSIVEPYLEPVERRYWAEEAKADIESLRSLKGTCSGPCLVVGNGISQTDIPLDWIHRYPTFGLNYHHKREGFEPSYIVIGDTSVAIHEWKEATALSVPLFLPSPDLDSFGSDREKVYRYIRVPRDWDEPFGDELDPTKGILFSSVSQMAAVLAYWMGYTEVLFIGIDGGFFHDHHYAKSDPANYPPWLNDRIIGSWDAGFAKLSALLPVPMLNLSTQTTLTSLPRANWQSY